MNHLAQRAPELSAPVLQAIVDEIGGYEATHPAISGACAAIHARVMILVSENNAALRARCERLEGALRPAAYAIRALRSTIETIDSDERDRARKERRLPLIHTSVLNESQVALEDALAALAQPEDGK